MYKDATWYGGRPWPRPQCVRWGLSSPQMGTASPHFLTHVYCGQMAGCIKMALGTEVGIAPGHIVLDGDPAPLHKRGRAPNFRPTSIVANGCMDQDATWCRGRLRLTRHCGRWGPSSASPKGAEPPIFGQCPLWPNGWTDQDATWYGGKS